jgi:putative Mg2+ transporter-C (MgtC) family protein
VLRRFEDKNDHLVRRRVSIVLGDDGEGIAKVVAAIADLGVVVQDLEYETRLDEKRKVAATFDVQIPSSLGVAKLVEELEKQRGIRRVHVRHTG